MKLLLAGIFMFATSICLHAVPGLLSPHLQLTAKLFCVFGAIFLMFTPERFSNSSGRRAKDMFVGYSVLVPIAITGFTFNKFVDPHVQTDHQFDELYSFLLWGTLILAVLPAWGWALQAMKLTTGNPFQTWRSISANNDQDPNIHDSE